MVPWVVKMSQDDDWWGHMREPHLRFNAQMWVATGATGHCFNLSRGFVDWTPPPCDDWTQSLRERPSTVYEERVAVTALKAEITRVLQKVRSETVIVLIIAAYEAQIVTFTEDKERELLLSHLCVAADRRRRTFQ